MGVGRLRKRDFSDNLIDYLKLMLNGLPLGPGKTFFMVDSTSNYYTRLQNMGVASDNIVSSLSEGKALMTSDQGDNLLIFPGTYLSSASLTWDINDSKLIGVASPNQTYQPSTMTGGGVKLKCVTTTVAQILNVTGKYVQMHNIGTQNTYDAAGNISDIRLSTGSVNFYAKNCAFRGGTGATQVGTADCGVGLYVDTSVAGAGNGMIFENCLFGSSGNTIRTVGASCVTFGGGTAAGGFEPRFIDCQFANYSNTSGVYFINAASNAVFDRFLAFKRCSFYNFCNPATPLAEAIHCNNDTAWIIIDACSGFGFTKWASTGVIHTYVSAPLGYTTGGIAIASA
jgi:hypothetical protein